MKSIWIACGALVAGGLAYGTHVNRQDMNLANYAPLNEAQVEALFAGELDGIARKPLAMALLPGPMDGYDITLYVMNFTRNHITALNLDPFGAMEGQALVIETCWSLTRDVDLEYPVANGRGPMVLQFDTLGLGRYRSIGMDPDTYEDAAFGTTCLDMSGTMIEVAFEDGTRGIGRLGVTDRGNVGAFIEAAYTPEVTYRRPELEPLQPLEALGSKRP